MDKQLLDALNNLSDSLEMISKALEKKEGSNTTTTNALQSGDFSKQLTEISVSLKSIKSDTKKILEKQNTILQMQKQKDSDKKNAIDETGEDPKKQSDLKKGVTTILLIAVAVLAIGLAFKIIGKVDFLSVISLGLAIVLIAHAFQKVAEAKITVEQAITAGKVMVIMSIAIMLSSWVLSFIKPISFGQSITAILIAGMFTVIAFGIKKLINALGENIGTLMNAILFLPILMPAIALGITLSSWVLAFVTPISFDQAITAILIAGMFTVIAFGIKKLINALGADITTLGKAVLLLPLILPAIALGIAASSWVLQMITPIKWDQALTGILIAAMFTVISYGMGKLLSALKGIDPETAAAAVILMPILLVALSMAIAYSSHYLAKTTEIKWEQFWTIIGISIVFVVLAFALKLMAPAIRNIKIGDVIILPLLFTALSLAIMVSSKILAQTTPIDDALLFNIVMFSIVFAISTIALGFAAFVLAKIGVEKIAEGGLCMIILAGVVAVSSLLISEGKYEIYPGWEWALGTGASILAFGLIATVFGLIIESGIGAAALALGAVAILLVAGVIVATSYILSEGKYENYPDIGWIMGVGTSMLGFGIVIGTLGTFILGSLGLGMLAIMAGSEAVLMIAETIVEVSKKLKEGTYTGGPTKEWSEGVSLAIGAFSPVYAALSNAGFFSVKVTPEQMSSGILSITDGIITAANRFSSVKTAFKKGPSKVWSEGVGLAIAAFAPVYKALSSGGFFSVKVTPEQMSSGILSIVDGIILAANKFSESKALFKSGPTKEWSEGVGSAMIAFSPIFKALNSAGFFTSGDDVVESIFKGITWTAQAIVNVAHKFSKVKANVWEAYPKKEWVNSVKSIINTFVGMAKSIKDINWIEMGSIDRVASRIVNTAKILSSGTKFFSTKIDPNYIKSLSSNVVGFANLAKKLTEINKGQGTLKTLFGQDPVSQTANSMVKLASAYDKLATSLKKFSGALSSIDGNKVNLIRRLTGNLAVLAAMNQDNLENMMKTLEERASVFSKLVEVDGEKSKRPTVGDKKVTATTVTTIGGKQKMNTNAQLDMIIQLLGNINQTTKSLDEHVSGAADGKVQTTSVSGGGNSGGDNGNWFTNMF